MFFILYSMGNYWYIMTNKPQSEQLNYLSEYFSCDTKACKIVKRHPKTIIAIISVIAGLAKLWLYKMEIQAEEQIISALSQHCLNWSLDPDWKRKLEMFENSWFPKISLSVQQISDICESTRIKISGTDE